MIALRLASKLVGWSISEASVFHFSMSISDHCLLALSLKCRQPRKPMRKRFMFEAIWTREDGCRDIIKAAWDPLENSITDKGENAT